MSKHSYVTRYFLSVASRRCSCDPSCWAAATNAAHMLLMGSAEAAALAGAREAHAAWAQCARC